MRLETRFVGSGNAWIGDGPRRYRGWQLKCAGCGADSRIISSHKTNSLPPEVVLRKLTQAGWQVGTKPTKDKCPECQKLRNGIANQKQAELELSIANEVTAPAPHDEPPAVPNITLGKTFFKQLRACLEIAQLVQDNKSYIEAAIRGIDLAIENPSKRLKVATSREQRPKPVVTTKEASIPDAEYDNWLTEQD